MYFLGLGLLLLAGKYFQIGPVAEWSWMWVLSPFAAAVLWWWWADEFGYTIKTQEKKMEARRQARINKNKEALGMPLSSRNNSSGSSRKTSKR